MPVRRASGHSKLLFIPDFSCAGLCVGVGVGVVLMEAAGIVLVNPEPLLAWLLPVSHAVLDNACLLSSILRLLGFYEAIVMSQCLFLSFSEVCSSCLYV